MARAGRPLAMPAEQRKRDIQVAAERLFGERGYEKVTMADIAAEVGMSKKTLYAHFSDKKSLLNALVAASLVWPGACELDGGGDGAVERLAMYYKAVAEHVLSARHIGLCRLAIAEITEIAVLPEVVRRSGITASRQTLINAVDRIGKTRRALDVDSATLADMLFGATVAKPLFDALLAGASPDLDEVYCRIDQVIGVLFHPPAPG